MKRTAGVSYRAVRRGGKPRAKSGQPDLQQHGSKGIRGGHGLQVVCLRRLRGVGEFRFITLMMCNWKNKRLAVMHCTLLLLALELSLGLSLLFCLLALLSAAVVNHATSVSAYRSYAACSLCSLRNSFSFCWFHAVVLRLLSSSLCWISKTGWYLIL